jgi:hypothetical protein
MFRNHGGHGHYFDGEEVSKRKDGLPWYWFWVDEPAAVLVFGFVCFVIMVLMAVIWEVKK